MCCMPSRSPRISRTPRPPSPPLRATDHHLIVNASGCFSDLGTYLTMAKRGVALVISGRRAQISPIDGADLATPIREQLENGTTGDLDVGGPRTSTHREVAELAFTTLDRTPRIVSMPVRLACIGLAPARMVAPSAEIGRASCRERVRWRGRARAL